MMTQEEFMDVMAMKRQGMSIKEIAEETGYHPSTISGWLRNGGPPEQRPRTRLAVIDEHWAGEIAELLRVAPRLLATSVFELIRAKGYHRLLCQRGPAPQHVAWPEVRGRPGGLDADRDRTG